MILRSEMAAKVWQVMCTADDPVAQGAELIILESMKMEIPVTSPQDGRIVEVCVAPGDLVGPGDPLVEIG